MTKIVALVLSLAICSAVASDIAELIISWDETPGNSYSLVWKTSNGPMSSVTITNGQRIHMTNFGQVELWLTASKASETSPPSNKIIVTVNRPAPLPAPTLYLESFRTNLIQRN
jgi:hypothetical protein